MNLAGLAVSSSLPSCRVILARPVLLPRTHGLVSWHKRFFQLASVGAPQQAYRCQSIDTDRRVAVTNWHRRPEPFYAIRYRQSCSTARRLCHFSNSASSLTSQYCTMNVASWSRRLLHQLHCRSCRSPSGQPMGRVRTSRSRRVGRRRSSCSVSAESFFFRVDSTCDETQGKPSSAGTGLHCGPD